MEMEKTAAVRYDVEDDYAISPEEELIPTNKYEQDISVLWSKKEEDELIYYTFPGSYWESVREEAYCGDGSKMPSPKEVAEVLNEKSIKYPDFNKAFGNYSYVKEKVLKLDKNLTELPNDSYEYLNTNNFERLVPIDIRKDGNVELSNSISSVYKSINNFIERESVYKDNKLIYKLGVLLYGPPGGGKTALIRKLIKDIIIKDSVVFFLTTVPSVRFLNHVNKSLKNRYKIFIFEELTEALKSEYMERFLNFLDGEHSMDKSIVIATTNFPEEIPGNIVNRPSRFDKLIYCGFPNAQDRTKLISYFLKKEPSKEEIEATNNLSIAAIKEICLRVLVDNEDFMTSAKDLQERTKICEKMFKNQKDAYGFGIEAKKGF